MAEAGWGCSLESKETSGVASGHPAQKQPERRAGRASGKFQAAAEGSLQRAHHSPWRGGGGVEARDSSGVGWAS